MRKYRIVIVENDEDEQLFMKEGFDKSDLFTIVAQLSNGNELHDWLESNPENLPELILSDLNMPGRNGYDILDEVTRSARYSKIPVIITSTSFAKSIIERCYDRGAADYLPKPDTFIEYGPFVKNLYDRIQEKQLVK